MKNELKKLAVVISITIIAHLSFTGAFAYYDRFVLDRKMVDGEYLMLISQTVQRIRGSYVLRFYQQS